MPFDHVAAPVERREPLAGLLRLAGRWLFGLFAAVVVVLSGTAGAPAQDRAGGPVVTDARIVGDDNRTRFVADLSRSVGISVFTLADPYRVVVDLPELAFDVDPSVGQSGRGLISAFRYGLISKGKSRIVLDMTDAVAVDKAFVLDAAGAQPSRLVIDVVPTSRAEFMANYERENLARTAEDLKSDGTAAAPDRPKSGRPLIVLDPGHGGIDSGAVGSDKTLEKDIVLTFAVELAEKLRKTGHFDVILTREDDTFVRLSERVAIARRNHADLFVSIHADSFRGHGVRGATVYTLSERASNEMAAQLAESENRSDIIAGLEIEEGADDVADILLDLTRRETKNFSIVMAQEVVQRLRSAVRLFKNPHQQAGFVVLKAPDVPSILLELGYLSNQDDEKLLATARWREEAIDAMTAAIDGYFRTRIARGALR